jgi:hypothetical protein
MSETFDLAAHGVAAPAPATRRPRKAVGFQNAPAEAPPAALANRVESEVLDLVRSLLFALRCEWRTLFAKTPRTDRNAKLRPLGCKRLPRNSGGW